MIKEFEDVSPAYQRILLPSLQSAYDSFHSSFDAIRVSAEKSLRPLFSGHLDWLPIFQKYRDVIDYWKRIIHLRKGHATC